MRVQFPNPYGAALPGADEVQALQSQQGFSDAYARFLRQQNGFNTNRFDHEPDVAKAYISGGEDDPFGCPDLAWLFQLNAEADYLDLAPEIEANLFKQLFMPIGATGGGNPYGELLAGRWRGLVASLDHELFASADSLQEFCDNMELELIVKDKTPDELADALFDPALGLAWFHANSMDQFIGECICCDERLQCFVRDADDLPDELQN